jgi:hypothetical protein
MSFYVVLCCVVLYHVLFCYVVLCPGEGALERTQRLCINITYIMFSCVVRHGVTRVLRVLEGRVGAHTAVLCCVLLRYNTLRYVTLCYVMSEGRVGS